MGERMVDWKQNLALFAAAYVGLLAVYVFATWAIEVWTGYSAPSVIGLLVFYLAAHWSGRHYAIRSDWRWERSDRFALAAMYSAIAIGLSFLWAAGFILIDQTLQTLPVQFWTLVVALTPIIALVQYGIARWAFAKMDEHEHRAGATK